MRRKSSTRFSLQFRFFMLCMLAFVIVAVLSDLMGWLLKRWLDITIEIPLFVWMILFSVAAGSIVIRYITRSFFDPITRLGKAMKEVSDGNFQTVAECGSRIQEVRDIYACFNLMVQELNATETLQTDFISSVSHEFKTPINAIEGYVSLLQDPSQTEEERQTYIEKILFNTRRLSTLAGNILLLSRIDSQSIHPQRISFRLDEQVRQSIVALESKWSGKDLCFDVELDPVVFYGFEGLLCHVWLNLIDNAVKFTPCGGLIRMRMFREKGQAVFRIEDSGPGVAPEEQKRIFNKFYQGDSSRKMDGNGLGLALVKKIVEMSGGSVSVMNLPESGCRFTVCLPD